MSTILVVDDLAVFRQPIAAAVKAAGYDVVCAADGNAALKAVEDHRIDLVLLDLAMPAPDGVEVLRILRQNPKHRALPVIVLTAVSERERIVQVAQLNVSDYLLKSRFSLSDLLARIRKQLEQSQGSSEAPSGDTGGPARENSGVPSSGATRPEPSGATVSAPRAGGRAEGAAPPPSSAPEPEKKPAAAKAPATEQPPPDPKAALNSLEPVMSRAEVEQSLGETEGMKGFSPTVMRLLTLTNDPNCRIDLVVKAICQDHVLALKILKLANSVAFTRGEPVDAVREAVLRIGLGRIRQAILNIGIVERFGSLGAGDLVHGGQFWEHAIACGVAAGKIAELLEQHDPDVAFTAGLLHDVGRLVLLQQLGEKYIKVMQRARELELPIEQVETRMLRVNHADVMEHVLRLWRFSPHLAVPIVHHHLSATNLRGLVAKDLTEAATLALANRLVHGLALGCSGNAVVYATEAFVDLLRLKDPQLREIENTVMEQTADLKVSMLAKHSSDEWPQMSRLYREGLSRPMRFDYHGDAPGRDAFYAFCRQLGEAAESEPPNVGVVHLANDRQRSRVSQQVLDAEARSGGVRPPLVIISPSGEATLEGPVMNNRPARLLRSPVPVSRFVRAVNELLEEGVAQAAA
jgi:HD-like signal output (HDOD) protein/CheY-like chemotaxis protein